MASQEEVKKNLAKTEKKSLRQLIEESAKELDRALPEHMNPERLVRIALTCIKMNPTLANCTSHSFLGALFTSAQLGLEPIAGRAYLIPFNNKRQLYGKWMTLKEVQFVIGYRGLVELFFRHDKAVSLNWGTVKQNDVFEYELGTNSYISHKPNKGDRGDTIGYYVIATLANGGKPFMYQTLDECMEHGKKHSKTFIYKQYDKEKKKMVECDGHFVPSSPWLTNTDSMCLKTVLKMLSKLMPLSVDLQRAIQVDETSRDYRKGVKDALEMPDTTKWLEDKESKPEGVAEAEITDSDKVKEENKDKTEDKKDKKEEPEIKL